MAPSIIMLERLCCEVGCERLAVDRGRRCPLHDARHGGGRWSSPKSSRRRDELLRRLRKTPTREPVDRRKVFDRDNWCCGICKNKIDPRLKHPDPKSASLDHIVPISKGGQHSYVNTQATHLDCNVGKGNRGGGEQLALIG